jgi:hypothetical protein
MLMTRRRLGRRRPSARSWSLIGLAALSGLILSGQLVARWRRHVSGEDPWLDDSEGGRLPQRELWSPLQHLGKIQRQGRLSLTRLVRRPRHVWSGEDS